MKAFKGFNSDLTCRGFKYKVGETYEIEGKPELGKYGFHACENPITIRLIHLFMRLLWTE